MPGDIRRFLYLNSACHAERLREQRMKKHYNQDFEGPGLSGKSIACNDKPQWVDDVLDGLNLS
jgi:hypothetical protein